MNDKSGLILVGVVHGDPNGYDKLSHLLNQLRPGLITLEISDYSWHWRRRWEAAWLKQFHRARRSLPPEQQGHLALHRVAAQIAMPFEVRAAAAYGRRQGIAWQAVDLKALARQHLPLYHQELLRADNLRALTMTADSDWGDYTRREYRRACQVLQTGRPGGTALPDSPLASLREKVLARRVAHLAKQWRRVVHVGGWEHLLRSGPKKTMADFLAPLQPQRLLLDEHNSVLETEP